MLINILIKLTTGFAILLFIALVMAIISRLNSLSQQRNRIQNKLSKALEDEKNLIESGPAEEPA